MKKVARMIAGHHDNIATCFTHPITDAAAEGRNGRIQQVKGMVRGFRNSRRFRMAIYFHSLFGLSCGQNLAAWTRPPPR